jgi:hypothetical protein
MRGNFRQILEARVWRRKEGRWGFYRLYEIGLVGPKY